MLKNNILQTKNRISASISKCVESIKLDLVVQAKEFFGVSLENFPKMQYSDNGLLIDAPGLFIDDNFSCGPRDGSFLTGDGGTAIHLIIAPILLSLIYKPEGLFLHTYQSIDVKYQGSECPPEFYMLFYSAVLKEFERDATLKKRKCN